MSDQINLPAEQPSVPIPASQTVPAGPPQPLVQFPIRKPILTYTILAVNILVFLLDSLSNLFGLGYRGIGLLTLLGAKSTPAILAGEYWRLVTPMFLHAGIAHIGFNSYFLYLFGPRVERAFGSARFAALYLLAGTAGTVVSFALSPGVGVGASGALFGLTGALLMFLYRNRRIIFGVNRWMSSVLQIVIINLLIGVLVPGIDNWAHLGGLLTGALLGWFTTPCYEIPEQTAGVIQIVDRTSQRAAWLAVALFAAVLIVATLLLAMLKG